MSYAKRTDINHAAIREALRAAGATVTDTSMVGHGYPDLTVSFANQWFLLEVKQPGETLTADQERWHAKQNAPVHIVRTVKEALAVLGIEAIE